MAVSVYDKKTTNKNVKTHSLFLLGACVVFGIINIITYNAVFGIITMLVGIASAFVSLVLMKDKPYITRGIFLTQLTTVIIVGLSASKGELHSMFALLAGNLAIGSIYYNLKNINIAWISTDIILIGAIFFKNTFYVNAAPELLINGILGFNIAAVMIRVLVKNCIDSVNMATIAAEKADGLVVRIRNQVEEGERLTKIQSGIMSDVTDIAAQLETSSNAMLQISDKLSAASEEQSATISDICQNIEQFARDAENCSKEASKAFSAAGRSQKLLLRNNESMNSMVSAMERISETSGKISTIIKTIDDISFQTNILALNAAVEANRAGTAGKGFAVVADEVRNLANKSAEAANSTTILINEAIKAINDGSGYATEAAGQMEDIINCSKMSETYAKKIEQLIKNQQLSVNDINSKISSVSQVINENSATASESAEIARAVSGEIERMNNIVMSR